MAKYNSLPSFNKHINQLYKNDQLNFSHNEGCYLVCDKFEREFEETLAMFDALLVDTSDDFLNDSFSDFSQPHKVENPNKKIKAEEEINENKQTIKIYSQGSNEDEDRPKSFLHDEVNEFNDVFSQLTSLKFTSSTLNPSTNNHNKASIKNYIYTSNKHSSSTSLDYENCSRNPNQHNRHYVALSDSSRDSSIDSCGSISSDTSNSSWETCSDTSSGNRDKWGGNKTGDNALKSSQYVKVTNNLQHKKLQKPSLLKSPSIKDLCKKCIQIKRRSCAEILRTFYFESLSTLNSSNLHLNYHHNYHSLNNSKFKSTNPPHNVSANSSIQDHTDQSDREFHHQGYSTVGKDFKDAYISEENDSSGESCEDNERDFRGKYHTINHNIRPHHNRCVLCNTKINKSFFHHSMHTKNSENSSNPHLTSHAPLSNDVPIKSVSDSDSDDDDSLIIRESNDEEGDDQSYDDDTLKGASLMGVCRDNVFVISKEESDSAYQTGEREVFEGGVMRVLEGNLSGVGNRGERRVEGLDGLSSDNDDAGMVEMFDGRRKEWVDFENTLERFNRNKIGLKVQLLKTNYKNNSYQGTIGVYMNLNQPISIKTPSVIPMNSFKSDALLENNNIQYNTNNRKEIKGVKRDKKCNNYDNNNNDNNNDSNTFFLPNDSYKVIHITSESNTAMVIQILLDKFSISNPPHHYALFLRTYDQTVNYQEGEIDSTGPYQQIYSTSQQPSSQSSIQPSSSLSSQLPQIQRQLPYSQPQQQQLSHSQPKQQQLSHSQPQQLPTTCHMRKLQSEERPLLILLEWFEKDGHRGLERSQFVLQNYSSGDIIWEAFSIQELKNFLKILEKEEATRKEEVVGKYNAVKKALRVQMKK